MARLDPFKLALAQILNGERSQSQNDMQPIDRYGGLEAGTSSARPVARPIQPEYRTVSLRGGLARLKIVDGRPQFVEWVQNPPGRYDEGMFGLGNQNSVPYLQGGFGI